MTQQHPLIKLVNSTSLVSQILVGLVFGILLAMFMPEWAKAAGLLGSLFVGALKAVAPLLVFVLVTVAITVVQERRSERALEALRDLSSPRALASTAPRNSSLCARVNA